MQRTIILGVDLAKRMFQARGAATEGSVVFRKMAPLLPFLGAQPHCTVAMEACATADDWKREVEKLGHVVRLIAPIYVKP